MRGKKRPTAERQAALSIALVDGSRAAAAKTGLAESTIRTWMERPEFAQLREKTREDLAEGFRTLAHLAMTRLMEAMQRGEVEPRDLAVALGIATDKHLLMSGQATSRSETRSLMDGIDDETRQRLRDWLDEKLEADPGTADGSAGGTGTEVRQPATA